MPLNKNNFSHNDKVSAVKEQENTYNFTNVYFFQYNYDYAMGVKRGYYRVKE